MVVTAGTIGGYDSEDPSSKLIIVKTNPFQKHCYQNLGLNRPLIRCPEITF